MYPFLLGLHNLLRWLVVLAAVWAIAVALRGLLSRSTYGEGARRAGLAFTSVLNLQFLVGIALYLVSPLLRDGGPMADMDGRLGVMEHVGSMFLAVVAAQLGYSLARRAETDRAKYVRATVGYVLAGLLILWATPWGRSLVPWG